MADPLAEALRRGAVDTALRAEIATLRAEVERLRTFVRQEQEAVRGDLVDILAALGLGDHARPYSSHQVVQLEVLPAIRAALAAGDTGPDARRMLAPPNDSPPPLDATCALWDESTDD